MQQDIRTLQTHIQPSAIVPIKAADVSTHQLFGCVFKNKHRKSQSVD